MGVVVVGDIGLVGDVVGEKELVGDVVVGNIFSG